MQQHFSLSNYSGLSIIPHINLIYLHKMARFCFFLARYLGKVTLHVKYESEKIQIIILILASNYLGIKMFY